MPETVIISYRGANYAIGQGQLYYGIWLAASPHGQPIEWWQHTPEGWSAAWARFTSIEVPGTIGPVSGPTPAGSPATAAGTGPAGGAAMVSGPASSGGPAAASGAGAPQGAVTASSPAAGET